MSSIRRDFQVLTDLEDPICDSFSDLIFLGKVCGERLPEDEELQGSKFY